MARLKWIGLSLFVGVLLAGCTAPHDSLLSDVEPTPVTVFLPAIGGNVDGEGSDDRGQTELSETVVSTTNSTLIPPAPTTVFDPQGLSVGGSSSPEFIPLLDPRMIPAAQATWLDQDAMILGVIQNGDIRAYPVMQATYHHVINDTVGGEPYLVTF